MSRCKHENGYFSMIRTEGHYCSVTGGVMEEEGFNEEGNIISDKFFKWAKIQIDKVG